MQQDTINWDGEKLEVIERRGSNIIACNELGRFLFRQQGDVIQYIAVCEIYGSRTEPHITF